MPALKELPINRIISVQGEGSGSWVDAVPSLKSLQLTSSNLP